MTRFIFIHDFYRDGYNDMLAEVRELQESGQWTKQRRARVAKHEASTYYACKHKFPRMDMGYWAGRVAAIKSAATAHYPIRGRTIFVLLRHAQPVFCGSCGDTAVWKYSDRNDRSLRFHCDRCKQERVREQTCYSTPDGWDWDEHEDALLPLSVPQGDKLMVKAGLQPWSFFFPCAATIGLALLDISFHLPVPTLLLQMVFVLHLTVRGKDYWQEFRKLFESEL